MKPENENSNELTHAALWLLPATMLLIAILPLPYGYYTLLRIVFCITASIMAFNVYSKTNSLGFWVITFALIALLFNPIIPVFLTRELWFFIDIAVAGLFVVCGIRLTNKTLL